MKKTMFNYMNEDKKETKGIYEEKGLEDDLLVINMADLTEYGLVGLIDAIREDAEGEGNKHAVARLEAYLAAHYDI